MCAFDPMQMKIMVIEGLIESVKEGDLSAAETLGHTLGVGFRVKKLEEEGLKALKKALKSDNEKLREVARAAIDEIKVRIG
ncbi:MAG TPA: hypothetical protein G4O11_09570 [Anaerolineae bacterium]|nr:hypothetical protein [Anaerolineae bacterium]